jgi:hypothetical protein
MATVSFIYRSKKPSAFLILRLFFRFENKNKFVEIKTNIKITKDY